ncbi:uncharacterized protein LOC144160700 [Haemaphysalis longicornis]
MSDSANICADKLSRVDAVVSPSSHQPLHPSTLARLHPEDPKLAHFRASPTSLKLEEVTLERVLVCDLSTSVPRPFLPSHMRRPIFHMLHNMAHAGICATQRLVSSRFVWPRMNANMRNWVDRYTRWPQVTPIPDITASTLAAAFVSTWASWIGCNTTIITDRGRQSESSLFTELLYLLETTRLRKAANHPQTKGLVERFYRNLKVALTAHETPSEWVQRLLLTLLAIDAR